MLRTTAAAAALVLCLLLAACGSNDEAPSGANNPNQPAAQTPPDAPAAAVTPTPAAAKAAAKSAEKAAKDGKPVGPKEIEAAAKAENISPAQARKKLEAIARDAGATAKFTETQKRLKTKAQQQRQKANEALKDLQAMADKQEKPTGKVGTSGIVPAVKKTCNAELRVADGALTRAAAADALPGALRTTISQLKKAASDNSPYASGTTGDFVARIRTEEVVKAMQGALAPAKAYAASSSSANKAKLSKALTTLTNTAYADLLRPCAVA
jgi:hypothetical protein